MAAKAHAILSASSSDRWLHCPPSARLCETYEDKGSDYAAEGTDAHALGEHKLKTALGLPSEDPTDSLKWYSEEMEDCTSGYAEYVLEQIEAAKETCADPVVLIEQAILTQPQVKHSPGLLQMKSSPFVLSGLSPTSALRFPEMWRQMWPMPDATAALPWTRDISLSHRICYFRSSLMMTIRMNVSLVFSSEMPS